MSPVVPNSWTPFAEARETHSAAVFLFGDRAYKVKKQVDLGFLDFSTRERREQACHDELNLNARLAPDVYLGLTELPDPVTGQAEPVIVMRRMPDDRRLASLVHHGAPLDDQLRRLAHLIAGFHGRSTTSAEISAAGTRDALAGRWGSSFRQVRPFHGSVLHGEHAREVEELVGAYLAGRQALFESRIHQGAIVDGHGDLTAEDIFLLDDGPRVLDCLEFDPALRHVDRIDDAAFLAMDLERLGHPEEGRRFLDCYCELSGDHPPESLVHHYIAYRAFVRVKVSCLQHEQGVRGAATTAEWLLGITRDHLLRGQVRIVLVGGAPGTGKTTLAQGVADRLGMVSISSDRVRKELLGAPAERSLAAPFGHGAYSPEWTERTYAEMLRRAEALLAHGESVVLDATWADDSHRRWAAQVARRSHGALTAFVCEAPADVAARRIKARTSYSDADAEIATALRLRFGPWPDATVVDTSGETGRAIDLVERRVQRRPVVPPPRSRMEPD